MAISKSKTFVQLFGEQCRVANYFELSDCYRVGFLSLGLKLNDNIRKEWRRTVSSPKIIDKSDVYRSELKSYKDYLSLKYVNSNSFLKKFLSTNNVPNSDGISNEFLLPPTQQRENTTSDTISFNSPSHTILSSLYLVDESKSSELFYKTQAQRKIWWMKFSADPGRLFISELTNQPIRGHSIQTVSIQSKFPFGNIPIEHIDLIPINLLEPSDLFQEGKSIIRTSVLLEQATIETVFDAIDANNSHEICLHRKIAPIQCGILSFVSDASSTSEFNDFVEYIALLLKQVGISSSTFGNHLINCKETNTECFFKSPDSIGVPYCIIIDETAIQTGLLKLRNRDTTLSETIHISDIPTYIQKIVDS